MNKTIVGDCLLVLPTLEAASVQTCVTSPPYFGLRDYGVDGQIGLEKTPDEYVEKLVKVFREVKRVLRDDGVLWLNLGDSYAASGRGGGGGSFQDGDVGTKVSEVNNRRAPVSGLKQKDLIGIPWMVAFALRADGWYLRQDIIWSKPNPMPESVTDRCTKAHEYIFMLTKSARYYYDAAAIAEPLAASTLNDSRMTQEGYKTDRPERGFPGSASHGAGMLMPRSWKGSTFDKGKTGEMMETRGGLKPYTGQSTKDYSSGGAQDASETKRRIVDAINSGEIVSRNKRSVWTVTTKPFSGSHFATFPPDLIEPCILAGSKPGDVVLDPFGGSGTTGMVAENLGRQWVLIELNPEYEKISRERTAQQGIKFV